jgi:hypothetical protein
LGVDQRFPANNCVYLSQEELPPRALPEREQLEIAKAKLRDTHEQELRPQSHKLACGGRQDS